MLELSQRDRLIVDCVEDQHMTYKATAQKLDTTRGVVAGVMRRWRESMTPNGVREEIKGNERTLTLRTTVVRTLPELIEFMEIDLDQWYMDRCIFNFWGNSENPNTQVKVKAINRHPEALRPVISPLEVSIAIPPMVVPDPHVSRCVMYLADAQIGFEKSLRTGQLEPFHDRAALDVALQIAQIVQPDEIVLLGDWFDLADWTERFARSPSMYWTTQPALVEAAWWIGQFRQTTQRLVMLEGNHEKRLPDRIISQMKEAYGLRKVTALAQEPVMSIPYLLDAEGLGVEWIGDYPNGEVWSGKALRAEHGLLLRDKSGMTAARLIEDITTTTVFGHNHRQEMASKTLWTADGPRVIQAIGPGCLCRIDGAVPAKKKRNNWQQGLALVYHNGMDVLDTHLISLGGGCAYLGSDRTWIFARERVDELREATRSPIDNEPWPF